MKQKEGYFKKHLTLLFLLVALICMFGVLSGSNSVYAEENHLVTTNALGNHSIDYSTYTNKALPDQINANNVLEYVPIELFESRNTTIINGQKYGFVIDTVEDMNNAGNSYLLSTVLFYQIKFDIDSTTNIYAISIQTIEQKSFAFLNDTLQEMESKYNLALGNVEILNSILNQKSSTENQGAFYTLVNPSTKFTYNTGSYDEEVVSLIIDVIAMGIDLLLPVDIIGTVVSGVKTFDNLIDAAENNWQTSMQPNEMLPLPNSKEDQISDNRFGGHLVKMHNIKQQTNQYLTANTEVNYFRIDMQYKDEDNIGFYAYSDIKFDVYRYTQTSEVTKVSSYETECLKEITDKNLETTELKLDSNGGFAYESNTALLPLLNSNTIEFTPKKSGYYYFTNDSEYNCEVIDVNKTAKGYYLTKDILYNIAIAKNNQLMQGSQNEPVIYTQDMFYDGKVSLLPVNISIFQKLSDDVNGSIVENISYKGINNINTNSDFYKIIINDESDINNLELYILDKDLNVLNSGFILDNQIISNTIFEEGKQYIIVCVNNGSEMAGCLTKESEKDYSNMYNVATKAYYCLNPKYNNIYTVGGRYSSLVDKYNNIIEPLNGNQYFLYKDSKYYIYVDNIQNPTCNLSINGQYITDAFPGNTYNNNTSLDKVYAFYVKLPCVYKFLNATICDVYNNNSMIYSGVNECYLEAGNLYYFVALDNSEFGFDIVCDEITLNESKSLDFVHNSIAFKYESVNKRVVLRDSNSYQVYDANFNLITEDHGYFLEEGTYYFVIQSGNSQSCKLEEYLQEVGLRFFDGDEEVLVENNQIYYYGGKYTLPTIEKMGYDFNGWLLEGVLITNSNGQMYSKILQDTMDLQASWTVQSVIMEILMEDNSIKWWTGTTIVDNEPEPILFHGELFEQLINLKQNFTSLENGKKDGHVLRTFNIERLEDNKYRFIPVWEREKYYVSFYFQGERYTKEHIVTYGDIITEDTFNAEIYDLQTEAYKVVGWKLAINTDILIDVSIGAIIPDLTPTIGSEFDYACGGNELNCTFVTLEAEYTKREYDIIIGKNSYEKYYGDEIIFETPDTYGYEDYLGCNVYYEGGNYKFYIGDSFIVSGNISFTLKTEQVLVAIKYTNLAQEKDVIAPFATQEQRYLNAAPTALSTPSHRRYDLTSGH